MKVYLDGASMFGGPSTIYALFDGDEMIGSVVVRDGDIDSRKRSVRRYRAYAEKGKFLYPADVDVVDLEDLAVKILLTPFFECRLNDERQITVEIADQLERLPMLVVEPGKFVNHQPA